MWLEVTKEVLDENDRDRESKGWMWKDNNRHQSFSFPG